MATRHAPIVTLTVNPALDVSTSTEQVTPEHKLRCGPSRLDPGGGGVNVSRVVGRLGGHAPAVVALGGPTGEAYRRLLDADSVTARVVSIAGSTRENFTVDETSSGEQFRFVLQGPQLTEDEWQSCLDATAASLVGGGWVVPSGSLPPGVPDDFYARLARLAHDAGARCVVDASGEALVEALREGVYLVKPSGRELGEIVGATLSTFDEKVAAARELVGRHAVEVVVLSLGADGAALVTKHDTVRLASPPITVRSTVGAGDSMVAAIVLRLAEGRSLADAFRAGVAAGAATASTPATELCDPNEVARLEALLTR